MRVVVVLLAVALGDALVRHAGGLARRRGPTTLAAKEERKKRRRKSSSEGPPKKKDKAPGVVMMPAREAVAPRAGDPSLPRPDPKLEQFIVDEPGKLNIGDLPTEASVKAQQKKDRKAAAIARAEAEAAFDVRDVTKVLTKSVDTLGGRRPDDPSDSFDYGIGGLVKKSVYYTAAALVCWEIYINSPAFERAAPPPLISGFAKEMENEGYVPAAPPGTATLPTNAPALPPAKMFAPLPKDNK